MAALKGLNYGTHPNPQPSKKKAYTNAIHLLKVCKFFC